MYKGTAGQNGPKIFNRGPKTHHPIHDIWCAPGHTDHIEGPSVDVIGLKIAATDGEDTIGIGET
jgi:hypothetical protein